MLKAQLDKYILEYETKDFIKDDPVQFIHKFNDEKDIEIAGFIASILAYGNRKVFIKKLDELFQIAENEPLNFVLNFEPKVLGNFNYRFGKAEDFTEIFQILRQLYEKDGGLEELFKYGYCERDILKMFQVVSDYFYSRVNSNFAGQGFSFMIPNPKNGGAMKRMSMFLRWMVRDGNVDLGIWDFVPKSELVIPLDVHVARVSREMGLLKRSSNDFKAVMELMSNLKVFDSSDPAKYDFAMFGYGVNRN